MTIQEEIREGIAREQFVYWCCADEELYPRLLEDLRGVADKILRYLDSKGVGVQVKRVEHIEWGDDETEDVDVVVTERLINE